MTRKWKWLAGLLVGFVLITTLAIMNPVLAGKTASNSAGSEPAQYRPQNAGNGAAAPAPAESRTAADLFQVDTIPAYYNIQLRIDTIEGESLFQHPDGEGWIDVLSFRWGLSQPLLAASARAGAASGGKVAVETLDFTHLLDKASPKLMTACAKGEHLREAVLELWALGSEPQKFYELKLNDVIVSSVDLAGMSYMPPAGDVSQVSALSPYRPSENVALNFSKIEWTWHAGPRSEAVYVKYGFAQLL
jgi:type VI secretion system secreted protein Hcp